LFEGTLFCANHKSAESDAVEGTLMRMEPVSTLRPRLVAPAMPWTVRVPSAVVPTADARLKGVRGWTIEPATASSRKKGSWVSNRLVLSGVLDPIL
jgi:hypothetical protein